MKDHRGMPGYPALALDRSSARRIDEDGHLHVQSTPISAAVVSPYFGREIPDWQKLGLHPDRTYQLYRYPGELKKGAATFEGKPLLLDHEPVSAADHPKLRTVGSIGAPVEMRGATLYAPLTVWDGDAINGIVSGRKKALSAAYRYQADMTPGTAPDGSRFDGVMRDIIGNHLALVDEPRVPGSVVADSLHPELRTKGNVMKTNSWRGKFALDNDDGEPPIDDKTRIMQSLRSFAASLSPDQWSKLRELIGFTDKKDQAFVRALQPPEWEELYSLFRGEAQDPEDASFGAQDARRKRPARQSRHDEQAYVARFPDANRLSH